MALVDRTAYPRLSSTVSGRELAEAFMPAAEEVRWARAKIADPGTRLSLLVLLKCYQRLGYFPQLEQVPSEVTWHVHARAAELVRDRIGMCPVTAALPARRSVRCAGPAG